jgi:hypothetical protein
VLQRVSIMKSTVRMTHMQQHTTHTIHMFRITKTIHTLRLVHMKAVY